ncbi:MAG: hypothetical protein QXT63_05730 [Thermoplasmata archaeon]
MKQKNKKNALEKNREVPFENETKDESENTVLVIDNHEKYSAWLMLEYEHSLSLWKNTIFTNVKDKKLKRGLDELGVNVFNESVSELAESNRLGDYTIHKQKSKRPTVCVLDPRAEKELTEEDYEGLDFIVIGGILGYAEMKGRTESLITKLLEGCSSEKKIILKKRNLGKKQLSIDIATFISKAIYLGAKLNEIELTTEIEIEHPEGSATVLPYGYPIIDGKVIITPGLVDYLRKR